MWISCRDGSRLGCGRSWLWGLLFQLGEDSALEAGGFCDARPTLLDISVATNEELFKIPLNGLHAPVTLRTGEPFEEGIGFVSLHFDFLHRREGYSEDIARHGLDLLDGTGLLAAELVTGEAQNDEVIGMRFVHGGVELLEALVLLCKAAFGRDIDDEYDLALVLGQRNLFVFGWRKQTMSALIYSLLLWRVAAGLCRESQKKGLLNDWSYAYRLGAKSRKRSSRKPWLITIIIDCELQQNLNRQERICIVLDENLGGCATTNIFH